MSGTTRLFLVAALLAVALVGVALLAGYPSELTPGEGDGAASGDAGGRHGGGDRQPAEVPPGLQVADEALRLTLERSTVGAAGPSEPFSFRIVDAQGRPVRDFEVQHARTMHFIVVRRDLAGFQHLHPTMTAAGTWTTRVELGEAGTYRVFADFRRDGEQRTLGADVQVGGLFRPRPLPRPARLARTDGGLQVALRGAAASAGEDTRVEFELRDGGRVVTGRLEPYLGAKGHLVALRAGDLAYLHTHPQSDEPAFTVDYPSAGAYRLFAQLRYEGRTHTAAFHRERG